MSDEVPNPKKMDNPKNKGKEKNNGKSGEKGSKRGSGTQESQVVDQPSTEKMYQKRTPNKLEDPLQPLKEDAEKYDGDTSSAYAKRCDVLRAIYLLSAKTDRSLTSAIQSLKQVDVSLNWLFAQCDIVGTQSGEEEVPGSDASKPIMNCMAILYRDIKEVIKRYKTMMSAGEKHPAWTGVSADVFTRLVALNDYVKERLDKERFSWVEFDATMTSEGMKKQVVGHKKPKADVQQGDEDVGPAVSSEHIEQSNTRMKHCKLLARMFEQNLQRLSVSHFVEQLDGSTAIKNMCGTIISNLDQYAASMKDARDSFGPGNAEITSKVNALEIQLKQNSDVFGDCVKDVFSSFSVLNKMKALGGTWAMGQIRNVQEHVASISDRRGDIMSNNNHKPTSLNGSTIPLSSSIYPARDVPLHTSVVENRPSTSRDTGNEMGEVSSEAFLQSRMSSGLTHFRDIFYRIHNAALLLDAKILSLPSEEAADYLQDQLKAAGMPLLDVDKNVVVPTFLRKLTDGLWSVLLDTTFLSETWDHLIGSKMPFTTHTFFDSLGEDRRLVQRQITILETDRKTLDEMCLQLAGSVNLDFTSHQLTRARKLSVPESTASSSEGGSSPLKHKDKKKSVETSSDQGTHHQAHQKSKPVSEQPVPVGPKERGGETDPAKKKGPIGSWLSKFSPKNLSKGNQSGSQPPITPNVVAQEKSTHK